MEVTNTSLAPCHQSARRCWWSRLRAATCRCRLRTQLASITAAAPARRPHTVRWSKESVSSFTSALMERPFEVHIPEMTSSEKVGSLEGKIIGRDASKNELTVEHGEVKGVMGPMTMGYAVR